LRWSPDGTKVAADGVTDRRLHIINVADGKQQRTRQN